MLAVLHYASALANGRLPLRSSGPRIFLACSVVCIANDERISSTVCLKCGRTFEAGPMLIAITNGHHIVGYWCVAHLSPKGRRHYEASVACVPSAGRTC